MIVRVCRMGAVMAMAVLLASALLRVDAAVPLHLEYQSRRGLQSDSKCSGVGRVGHGLKCRSQGLQCQQQQVSCKGIWNAETKKCYDMRVTCTCEGKKWSCPQVRCLPPDDRCTRKASRCAKLDVAQGKKCGRPGLQCPWASNPVTCGGGYNEATKQCEKGSVIEPPCTCTKDGSWSCVLPKCMQAAPDARCPEDCSKFNVAPLESCYGEGGTCPYQDFTCKDVYNEATGTCEDVTIHTQCDCADGQFMCAIPSCAPPDERCSKQKPLVAECWNEDVVRGGSCKTPGKQCPDLDSMICKGMWDDEKQTCYDQAFTTPCTCDGATSTWSCAVHIMGCRAPDERCTCPSPEKVVPGGKCNLPGADCPFSQGTTTCTGQWNEEKQGCYDSTIQTSCSCSEGQWICAMASCAPPDERCLPKEDVCPYGDKSAPIGHGLSCSSEGMKCSDYDHQVNCNGIFVPEKQVCYDTTVVPECACKESKWDCQAAEACPPFDPNCLNSCLYASQGVQCSDPGLECPSAAQTVTCVDQWNEELQSCYDVTINPPCHCDGESWSCAAVKCAPPDARCAKEACPAAEEISPMGKCATEGESCPWIPMTCGGATWNEDTQTCQTSTFTPSCFCSQQQWMCAIPMCAMPIPDARCSCDGQFVEHGELCFGEGGTCLNSITCAGQLQADGTCVDSQVTNKCQCSGGVWSCDMKSACPAPAAQCAK